LAGGAQIFDQGKAAGAKPGELGLRGRIKFAAVLVNNGLKRFH
jgi:hypothetical protein